MPGWLAAPNLAPPPVAVLAWVTISLAAWALGWTCWRWLNWSRTDQGPRLLASLGLGYVLLAYAVLAAGLLGQLRLPVLIAIPALALLIGLGSLRGVIAAVKGFLARAVRALRYSPYRLLYGFAVLWLILTFLGALGPSDARDWDGISEHLAQAKVYLRHGRVEPLWYDHHSQFPATVVMLYCEGLCLGGQGAAKLFHWGFAVLSAVALWRLTLRHVAPQAAGPAAWVLLSTPLFGWLATVGYVDLGSVFFCLLAVDYLLAWRREGGPADLARAGLMAGAGMTVKMQGLFTFGILFLAAVFWCFRLRRRLGPVILYAALAGSLAVPWYAKSWILTGNPVYPFAYGIFGGKHWSAPQAQAYAYHHASFGYGQLPPEDQWHKLSLLGKRMAGARHPLKLLIAPFTLTLFPEYYSPRQPRLTAMTMLSYGPMYLALTPLVLLLRQRKPAAVVWLVALFALFWVWWLESTQLERYLLPWIALVVPVAGLSLSWLWQCEGPARMALRTLTAVWSVVALLFLAWQVVPMAPVSMGMASAEAYLTANLDCYAALAYVNRYTSPNARIGTYGEPRLFYLDRDRIWADPGHSQLIDYAAADTPEKLVGEYRRLGLDYLLINQQFFGPLETTDDKLHCLLRDAAQKDLLELTRTFARGKFLLLRVTEP